jgi:hypothetical protein
VLAVVAGHMHWQPRSAGTRRWQTVSDGILYVNAARVPRIFPSAAGFVHHHVELTLGPAGVTASEVLVERHEAADAPSA